MKRFVVTGGLGFIGSYIVKILLKNNHDVTIIDNFYRGRLENLDNAQNKVKIKKIDILDYESLEKVISNVDGIFHQAALTSVPESFTMPEKYNDVNVSGTENIFKLAHKNNIKVVFASSSSVYGNPKNVPIKEDSEKHPINPYGKTKLNDELLAEKYYQMGTSIIGLRYFNVYGIGQTMDYAGVITRFIDAINSNRPPVIFGNGKQIRDFISVEDVAEANYRSMEHSTEFALLNVGTGIRTSILDLANTMISLSNKDLEPVFDKLPDGDVSESQADIELTNQTLSWCYKTSLNDGLKKFFFTDN